MNLTDDKIVFHRTRDVGEVLSTTFRVIRENLRSLLLGILYFCAPLYLAGVIFMVTAFSDIAVTVADEGGQPTEISVLFMMLGVLVFLMAPVMQLTYVNELVKYVAKNPEKPKPTPKDIWQTLKVAFLVNLVNSLVFFLYLFFAGMLMSLASMVLVPLFTLAGGIGSVVGVAVAIFFTVLIWIFITVYLYSLSFPIFFIATYENINIFQAIGRIFHLMHARKQSFWGSIFSNLISFFICYVLSLSFLVPYSIVMGVIAYTSGATEDFLDSLLMEQFIWIGAGVYYFLSIFFINIPLICFAIKYFDWVERLDGKGLITRINTIGNNPDFDTRSYEESY
jgi:hypothetical protein